jgi:hypothetical protein
VRGEGHSLDQRLARGEAAAATEATALYAEHAPVRARYMELDTHMQAIARALVAYADTRTRAAARPPAVPGAS